MLLTSEVNLNTQFYSALAFRCLKLEDRAKADNNCIFERDARTIGKGIGGPSTGSMNVLKSWQ